MRHVLSSRKIKRSEITDEDQAGKDKNKEEHLHCDFYSGMKTMMTWAKKFHPGIIIPCQFFFSFIYFSAEIPSIRPTPTAPSLRRTTVNLLTQRSEMIT